MIPTTFTQLDQLPLTPNGKLNRTALPKPDYAARTTNRAPETATQWILHGLYLEVLDITQVGIDDSFFELGGDSILSIKLVSRARAAGLPLRVRDVFEHQTIAQLAAASDRAAAESAADAEAAGATSAEAAGLTTITEAELAEFEDYWDE